MTIGGCKLVKIIKKLHSKVCKNTKTVKILFRNFLRLSIYLIWPNLGPKMMIFGSLFRKSMFPLFLRLPETKLLGPNGPCISTGQINIGNSACSVPTDYTSLWTDL